MSRIKILVHRIACRQFHLVHRHHPLLQRPQVLGKCAPFLIHPQIWTEEPLARQCTHYAGILNSAPTNRLSYACSPAAHSSQLRRSGQHEFCREFWWKRGLQHANKQDNKSTPPSDADLFGEASHLGLFAKFKLMYKKYWYILIPVHVVTSLAWFGGFLYVSKSGVDIAAVMHTLHVSDYVIQKFQNSSMGHYAIAYLLYKIATPVRYAVTLGGTTISIKYLVQMGHIKPLPTKTDLIRMYENKKAFRAALKAGKKENGST